jgi:hypothetical protein
VEEIANYFRWSPVTIGEGIMKVEELLRKDQLFEKESHRMRENWVKGKKENTVFSLSGPDLRAKPVPTVIFGHSANVIEIPFSSLQNPCKK